MTAALKIHELDPWFKEEVAREPGCDHLRRCFSCGTCTATCPVAELEGGFSPSRIIRQILYGLKEEVLGSPAIWLCLGCARCSFTCPQDVRFLDIIQGLRNLALQQGYVTPGKAAQLARGERLLQELRLHFLAELLKRPEGEGNLREQLRRVLDMWAASAIPED